MKKTRMSFDPRGIDPPKKRISFSEGLNGPLPRFHRILNATITIMMMAIEDVVNYDPDVQVL